MRTAVFAILHFATVLTSAAAEVGLAAGTSALERCREAARRQSWEEAAVLAGEAEEAFAGVAAGSPDHVAARVGAAQALMECRIEAAPMMEKVALMQAIEEQLAAALAADPDHWEARYVYGAFLYHVPPFLNRTDDAIVHLERLVAGEDTVGASRSPEPYRMLGDLYRRRDRAADARAAWRKGLDRHPGAADLQERLRAAEEAAAPAPASTPSPPEAVLEERLRRRLETEVARPEVAGMAVGVVRRGDPLLVEGFGFADLENEVPATPRTVFRIGSITKQFTAAAVLRLAEEERLDLDDPVSRWLPEAARAGEVRLHHLLSHTAGLPRDPVGSSTWIADSLAAPRLGAPGERYGYSNVGYGLLGLVVERASGTSWPAYLEAAFFGPLGMTATRPCDPREIIPRRAEGYTWLGDRLFNDDPLRYGPALMASGGLCSTLEDLLRWQSALHGGPLLAPESYRRMTTPPGVAAPEGTTYGFGVRVDAPRGSKVIHHSGGISGFLSELAWYPGEELAVAVLTNSEATDPRGLGFDLADLVRAVR